MIVLTSTFFISQFNTPFPCLQQIMSPHHGGVGGRGGNILFLVRMDPVSGGKMLINFSDLDLIFKVTGGLRLLENGA